MPKTIKYPKIYIYPYSLTNFIYTYTLTTSTKYDETTRCLQTKTRWQTTALSCCDVITSPHHISHWLAARRRTRRFWQIWPRAQMRSV